MIKVRRITAHNFKKFGKIIEFPNKKRYSGKKNLFCKVIVEPKPVGWRIAYLVVRDKNIERLEQHPGILESFEPVRGDSVLFVSITKDPDKIEAFYLNKPVVLFKDVWHGVICLGKESEVKITENADVKCFYWKVGPLL